LAEGGANNSKLEQFFRDKIGEMAGELAALAGDFRRTPVPPQTADAVYAIAHSLHGAGTMYGFPAVSEMGAALEELAGLLRSSPPGLGQSVSKLIESCAGALRRIAAAPGPKDNAIVSVISDLAWQCECTVRQAKAADPSTA